MQLVLIGLFVTVFAYEGIEPSAPPRYSGWVTLAIVLGPKLLLVAAYALACQRTLRLLGKGHALRSHRRLDRFTNLYGLLLLPLFVLDVAVGGLASVRQVIGDLVVIDELLLMLPTLGVMVAGWAFYHPIDRALREAALFRNIDDGHAVYPIWTRRQFIFAQLRHQVLLIFVPLMMIFAWSELLDTIATREAGPLAANHKPLLTALGAGLVLLCAPLVIRHMWDTRPLPAGRVREALESLCQRYRVRVRELLVWRTYGGMANAAVMGLVAPVRFILLSDLLLDRASAKEIEAVMAHELAHVKKRHMFWLLAAALGAGGVIELGMRSILGFWMPWHTEPAWWLMMLLAAPGLLLWAGWFGWVSRRVERQADTFAVQHLASTGSTQHEPGPVCVTQEAVSAMVAALQQVAHLNHLRPTRRNWRHGSIAWRQHYLKTLVGKPIDALPIDRHMKLINLSSLALLVVVLWWVL